MITATKTIQTARNLRNDMVRAGFEALPLFVYYKLVRCGQIAGERVDEELRKADRWARVQRGMVANHCADMRACGWYDGE